MIEKNNIHKWIELSPSITEIYHPSVYASEGPRTLPDRPFVFRALEAVAPEEVRVVILGQDPYHSVLQTSMHGNVVKASGLAFGFSHKYIAANGKLHSSLLNIREEVRASGFQVPEYPNQWYTLQHWAQQGVLLLNTRFTVLEGQPMSHAGLGWEDAILQLLTGLVTLKGGIIFLAWGSEAQKVVARLPAKQLISIPNSHPCKYSNTRTKWPFTGSKCFEAANKELQVQGKEPIKW